MNRLSVCSSWERRKLLIVRRGWVLLLLAVLLQIGIACFAQPAKQYTFDEKLYAEYVARFAGVWSEETAQTIRAEKETADQKRQLGNPEELEESQQERLLASVQYNVLSALEEKYSRLESCKEKQPILTYDLALTDYLRKFGMNWASLLALLCLCPMLMLGDAQCGMEQILFPAAIGRKTVITAKLRNAVILAAAMTAVCSGIQFGIMAVRLDFGALNVPVQSITGFEQCALDLSVRSCLLICWLLRIPAAAVFVLLVCLLSVLLRKDPAVISSAAILVGLSAFLAAKLPGASSAFLFSALSGMNAVKSYAASDLLLSAGLLLVKAALLWFAALKLAGRKQ